MRRTVQSDIDGVTAMLGHGNVVPNAVGVSSNERAPVLGVIAAVTTKAKLSAITTSAS